MAKSKNSTPAPAADEYVYSNDDIDVPPVSSAEGEYTLITDNVSETPVKKAKKPVAVKTPKVTVVKPVKPVTPMSKQAPKVAAPTAKKQAPVKTTKAAAKAKKDAEKPVKPPKPTPPRSVADDIIDARNKGSLVRTDELLAMQGDVVEALYNDPFYQMTPLGLKVREGRTPTFGAWVDYGKKLNRAGQSMSWALIDWVLDGQKLGEEYVQYVELTGYAPQTLYNIVSHMSRYTPDQRVDGVSITAHDEVYNVEPNLRAQLLTAMKEGLIESNSELRRVKAFVQSGMSVDEATLALTVPVPPRVLTGGAQAPTTPAPSSNGAQPPADIQRNGIQAAQAALSGLSDLEEVVDADVQVQEIARAGTINSAEYTELITAEYVHDTNGVLYPAETTPGVIPAKLAELARSGALGNGDIVLKVVIYRKNS